jgi:hypothetical protein
MLIQIWIENPQRNMSLAGHVCKREDNIEMDLTEIGSEDVS